MATMPGTVDVTFFVDYITVDENDKHALVTASFTEEAKRDAFHSGLISLGIQVRRVYSEIFGIREALQA